MSPAQLESPVTGEYVPGFDDAAFSRVSDEPALLQHKRKLAFAEYRALALPTARDDEWRRTDPALFPFANYRPAARIGSASSMSAGPWDDGFDTVVEVTEGGVCIRHRTDASASGAVTVSSLADAAAADPHFVASYLQGAARVKQPRKFSSLGDAFWNVGLVVRIAAKTVLPNGVLIRYRFSGGGLAQVPKLVVVAGEQSQASVVEHYESSDDADLIVVTTREFYAGRGAQLRVSSLQEWGAKTLHIGEDWARVERDAKIDWVSLLLGGRALKMMITCDVNEPNTQAYLSGLFFANGEQHVDQRTVQLHTAPNTYSNLLYKGAVKDRGHSVYQGIIDAAPGAIKVDAYQMNNNLILNDGARADSLPGLEIDADDLKCSHGATVGNLDPNQLFYLKSRGLSDAEARRTLVMAFFEEVIARIPHEFMHEKIREHVAAKMGAGGVRA